MWEDVNHLKILAIGGFELQGERLLKFHAAAMLCGGVESDSVEGVDLIGICWLKHQAVVAVLPTEAALYCGLNVECCFSNLGVHVPVKLQYHWYVGFEWGITFVPHWSVVDYLGWGLAHSSQVEVAVARVVGLDGHLLGLREIVLLLYFYFIGARVKHFEGINAVVHVVGVAGVERHVVHVHQDDCGVAHRLSVVVAKNNEIVNNTRHAVVANVACHGSLVEERVTKVVVGTEREVPTFHPAVVVVHQAVSLWDIIVERSFAEHRYSMVAAKHA